MSWFLDSLRDFRKRGDIFLLITCLTASVYGLILIYSATRYLGSNRSVLIQAVSILLGILVYIAASCIDWELLIERRGRWLAVFNLIFNLLVLTPLGITHNGNRSWLSLPGFPVELQPAEITKITFILLFSFQCVYLRENGISKPRNVFLLLLHTGITSGLIAFATHDFGMVLVYLFLSLLIAYFAGVHPAWFVSGAVCAAGGIFLAWPHIRDQYFAKRITVVIDHLLGNTETVFEQTQGRGWQQSRSILAIGSGGLTGQGYLKGVQTQSPFNESLNARSTDEIFAVCGEELGFIGCFFLILLLTIIIVRCFYISSQGTQPTSSLVAGGIGGMVLFQSILNIGMCLYVLPIVGLTLPFFSYGGSSVITLYAAMGIVSSVRQHR